MRAVQALPQPSGALHRGYTLSPRHDRGWRQQLDKELRQGLVVELASRHSDPWNLALIWQPVKRRVLRKVR